MTTLGPSIKKRARDEDLDPSLEREVKRIKTSPLDEAAGEGVHRASTKELKCAEASTTIHLKQMCRRKGTLVHVKQFCRTYGIRGEQVVRYEFRRWKRILQGSKKRLWRGVQRKDDHVLKVVYREDEGAGLNWQNMFTPEATDRPVQTEDSGNMEACQHEYLRALLEPGVHYTAEVPAQEVDEATGNMQMATKSIHFQLLEWSYGQHRPKLIHTVSSADDIALTAHLAMHIQPLTPWSREVSLQPGAMEVYPELDSKWIVPSQLAAFNDLVKNVVVWRTVEPSDVAGCDVWSGGERALVKHSVLHDKCPVLSLIMHLKSKGWIADSGKQNHTDVVPGPFDCVEAVKFRQYYQTLAVLERCLPLTSNIPSRQPIAFYRCLLQGLKVLPNESAKHYQLVINAHLRKHGKIVEVLPVEDAALPITDVPLDPDGIILSGAEQPPAQPKPKRQPAVSTGAPRKGRPKALPAPPGSAPPIVGIPPGSPSGGGDGGGGGGEGGGGCPPVDDPDGIVLVEPTDPDGVATGSSAPAPKRSQRQVEGRVEVAGLFGTKVWFQPYTTTTEKAYPNFIMACSRHKPPCMKVKGLLPSNTKEFGAVEPLCFLHAWDGYDDPLGKKSHTQSNPPQELVRAMEAEHREELKVMLAALGVDEERHG